MNEAEYHKFYEHEESFWWFTGMRRILFGILENGLPAARGTLGLLDVGCGTGGWLNYCVGRLERLGYTVRGFGVDMHALAVSYSSRRKPGRIAQASATAIPLRDGQFDLITCFDVLQHIEDDGAALREIHRVCRPGGTVLVNEVAFDFLMDENSVAAHVLRRYTRGQLVRKMEGAGFSIARATYTNSVLFLPVAAVRLSRGWRRPVPAMERVEAVTCVRPYPRGMNRLLHNLLVAEGNALRWCDFPFGVSVSVMGEKR